MGTYSTQFILHEHITDRNHPHLDLRLLIPGKRLLESFALVNNKIPQRVGEKVLIIRGNQHGKYFLFIDDMKIPPGHHGAGTLKALQKGRMNIEGWNINKAITFSVDGDSEYLSGRYLISKMVDKLRGKNDTYILMKIKDK